MRDASARVRAAARRRAACEDGSMTIFALFTFLLILIVGGMAVDIMRHESNRARLQATLDRAVLAAADLEQTEDPQLVVESYFRTAGLLNELGPIRVTQGLNSRTVSVSASIDVDTFFMDLVGVESLRAPAAGVAEESIRDIEVVLVLDVSGSMVQNSSTRLANLKDAASEFVQTVLENDHENRISIAIVPFNGQVNIGAAMRPYYTNVTSLIRTDYGVTYLDCVDLPPSVYSAQTIPRGLAMPETALADTFTFARGLEDDNRDRVPDAVPDSYSSHSTGNNDPEPQNMWCPPTDGATRPVSTAGNVVRLPTRSIPTLQAHIDGLVGVGATSINAGMRWGMTLLDPGARPLFVNLASAAAIPAPYSVRPYDYRRANTRKIIVLMTDGENFAEERVNADFRSGTATDIWLGPDGGYSVFHASKVNRAGATQTARDAARAESRPFWVPHLAEWHARPWNGTRPDPSSMPYTDPGPLRRIDVDGDNDCDNNDQRGKGALKSNEACWFDATEQSWPAVWKELRMSWAAWQLYARPRVTSTGATSTSRLAVYNAQMDLFRTRTTRADMDDQLDRMCDRARAEGVVVFGIAFEAPAHGQQTIASCAYSPSYAYNAAGLEIRTAFRAIAGQINALRLTQ